MSEESLGLRGHQASRRVRCNDAPEAVPAAHACACLARQVSRELGGRVERREEEVRRAAALSGIGVCPSTRRPVAEIRSNGYKLRQDGFHLGIRNSLFLY